MGGFRPAPGSGLPGHHDLSLDGRCRLWAVAARMHGQGIQRGPGASAHGHGPPGAAGWRSCCNVALLDQRISANNNDA
jgi:hypothetical protein